MIPQTLADIKPEYATLVAYTKPGETYLIGPDSQNLNTSVFETDEPTCPIDITRNRAWAQEIRNATQPNI